jgi:cell division septal protein FtsQ
MLIGKEKGIRTPEFHKKKEREKWIKITLLVFLLLVIVGTPIYLLRDKHFLITTIEIKGNNVTKNEEIEAVVSKHLEGNYFWLIPHSSILLYPRRAIADELSLIIPRFKKVDIELLDIHTLSVSVEERTPEALYCRDISNPALPTDCYFLDASGYIFSDAPAFSGGVYFVYSSSPSLESPLRTQFVDPDTFPLLAAFTNSLAAPLYPKVLVDTGEEYQLVLAEGGIIKWKKTQALDDIRSNLESFVVSPTLKKQNKTIGDVLYIDLRFGNKIFYKFKGEL